MSKKTFRLAIISTLLITGLAAYAQDGAYNSYSPYTVFGVGDIYNQGTATTKSMGGVGIATRNRRYLNYMNPAAITARDTLSFLMDFGVNNRNTVYRQDGITSANNTFNISDFAFSFPIYRSLTFAAGITPFSEVAYDFSSIITDQEIIGYTGNISYASSGSGGLYQIFGGVAFTVWDRLHLGVQGVYIFGNISKASSLTFTDSSYRTIYSGYEMDLHAGTVKLGAQYEHTLGPQTTMTLGATYRFRAKMKGHRQDYRYGYISDVVDTVRNVVDTFGSGSKIKVADELGLGVSIKKGDKWMLEVNYTRSDWSSSNFASETGFANEASVSFKESVAESVRLGFEYTPNRNDIRYYYRRVTYRAGAYYNKMYYEVDGKKVNEFGLTLGLTLPVNKWYNGLTIGLDVGQRGGLNGELTRERYVGFYGGVNLHDIWFRKMRYE